MNQSIKRWRVWIGLLICLSINNLAAVNTLPFHHITDEDGLPTNQVVSLMQDREGFMWIGTSMGLSRYDGYRFVHYQHDPHVPEGLSDSKIWALHQDEQGFIWIGTEFGGLNRLDPLTGQVKSYLASDSHSLTDSSLNHNYVRIIHRAGKDKLWIGTSGGGLSLMDTAHERFSHFTSLTSPALLEDTIRAIQTDEMGGVWIGYRHSGLSYLSADGKTIRHWRYQPQQNSLCSDKVQSLYLHQQTQLYVATWDQGLCRLDLANGQWQNIPLSTQSHSSNYANTANKVGILKLHAVGQYLWLGSINNGIVRYNLVNGASHWFSNQPGNKYSLGAGGIYSILVDGSNNLWVATWEGGTSVARLDAEQFQTYRHIPGKNSSLMSGPVEDIVIDPQQRMWVGVEGGGISVKHASGDDFSHLKLPIINQDKLPNNDVQVLYYSDKIADKLWVGTVFAGLLSYQMDTQQWQQWQNDPADENTLSDNDVRAVLRDSQGFLWVATTNGLNRLDLDSGQIRRYLPDKSLGSINHYDVYVLFEDSQQRLWIGTNGGGVSLYLREDDRFQNFISKRGESYSLSHNTIWDINEGYEGNIYIATEKSLDQVKQSGANEFQFISRVAQRFTSIEFDQQNRLWLSSPKGVSLYESDKQQLVNFNSLDGVLSRHHYPSKSQDKQGRLYFGGNDGLTIFDPAVIKVPIESRQLHLVDFKVNSNKKKKLSELITPALRSAKTIILPSDSFGLRLEFSALNFRFKDAIELSYRLIGLDERWQQTDLNRVEFNYLQPGNYTLQIFINDQTGKQAQELLDAVDVAEVNFVIEAPFYRQWWAYLIYIVLTLLIVHRVINNYREKQLLKAMEAMSMSDQLTGLNNRFFLNQNISTDVALSERKWSQYTEKSALKDADLIFFIIDIDHFKKVNDIYGHSAGDLVLKNIAQVIKEVFRDSDYIIRWGGEEFLVIARESDRLFAPIVAERLRTEIKQAEIRVDDNQSINKTCSIGFCAFPLVKQNFSEISWEQTIELADFCMYAAKKTARDAWVGLLDAQQVEQLFEVFKKDPRPLLKKNLINVKTSISSEKSLQWPTH